MFRKPLLAIFAFIPLFIYADAYSAYQNRKSISPLRYLECSSNYYVEGFANGLPDRTISAFLDHEEDSQSDTERADKKSRKDKKKRGGGAGEKAGGMMARARGLFPGSSADKASRQKEANQRKRKDRKAHTKNDSKTDIQSAEDDRARSPSGRKKRDKYQYRRSKSAKPNQHNRMNLETG